MSKSISPAHQVKRSKPVHIYGLVDPRTRAIKYVGSAEDPQKRLAAHVRAPSIRLAPWILELRSLGMTPEIVSLSVVPPGEDWMAEEEKLINRHAFLGKLGPNRLLNTYVPIFPRSPCQ